MKEDIVLRMAEDENRVCSGACVTYLGVPFHVLEKRRGSPEDRKILDALFDRLVDERRQLKSTSSGGGVAVKDSSTIPQIDIRISEVELNLLVEVLEDVLQEHVGFDYDLELHVGPRRAAESMLMKLQQARRAQDG